MSISVYNLNKRYKEIIALNDLSFSIDRGEVVGLLGPNGAGKSTLIKIITSYIVADSGKVIVDGLDVNAKCNEVKNRIGYLPENNPLYDDMFVREYLEFACNLHFKKKLKVLGKVDELIIKTGLPEVQFQKIASLSKGYRQRVGIAQALINDPSVLILDEPTTGLDPNQVVEIRNLIKELGKNKTIIFSSHIMQEVEAICNRVIVLDRGKLVADGSMAELIDQFKGYTNFVVEFDKPIGIDVLKNEIEGINEIDRNDSVYIINTDKDIRSAIFEFAVSYNLKILSLNREEKSMEQVFHALTHVKK